jgi:hypothetical protein
MSNESEWPIHDAQKGDYENEVLRCSRDHWDDVRITSLGRDPRSIIMTCEQCEVKYWFETVPEKHIPGTEAYDR